MVDFNSEATVGTPAVDLVRVMALERLNNAIEGYEDFVKKKAQGYERDTSIISSRLYSLFLILEGAIIRKEGEDKAKEYEEKCLSSNEDQLKDMMKYFTKYLDELKLTRLDTKKVYDKTLVETENKVKGLN